MGNCQWRLMRASMMNKAKQSELWTPHTRKLSAGPAPHYGSHRPTVHFCNLAIYAFMHVHDPSSGRTWTGTASPIALVIRLSHPASRCPRTSMSLNHHSFNLARCCMKIERYIEHRAFPQDFKLPELSGMLSHHDIWCSISTILFRSPRRSRLACRLDSNQASLGNLLRRQETSLSGSTICCYTSIPTGHTKTVRAVT